MTRTLRRTRVKNEIRIEYSDEKRRFIYKEFNRIMTQIISFAGRKQNSEENMELAACIGLKIPGLREPRDISTGWTI